MHDFLLTVIPRAKCRWPNSNELADKNRQYAKDKRPCLFELKNEYCKSDASCVVGYFDQCDWNFSTESDREKGRAYFENSIALIESFCFTWFFSRTLPLINTPAAMDAKQYLDFITNRQYTDGIDVLMRMILAPLECQ